MLVFVFLRLTWQFLMVVNMWKYWVLSFKKHVFNPKHGILKMFAESY